ncbi:C40 family peptidase [Embleya sp. NPDC055664]
MLQLAGAALAALLLIIILATAALVALIGSIGNLGGNAASQDSAASEQATSDIPPTYLALYQQAAATCPGLSWTILAAIGKVESDHGRSQLPGVQSGANPAGAMGPMQFIPDTWATYNHPIPTGGSNPPSPYNPTNAIYAAANKLCHEGARDNRDLNGAIFRYNHADWYVKLVRNQATKYAAPESTAPSGKTAAVIAFARAQLGLPYVWGGDGPATGDAGFDCSGLTQAAYRVIGIELPRVAADQYGSTPKVTPGSPLYPGDLVFYGTRSNIHHVGLYIGRGQIIDAPHPGAVVRITSLRYPGDDFYGATRP